MCPELDLTAVRANCIYRGDLAKETLGLKIGSNRASRMPSWRLCEVLFIMLVTFFLCRKVSVTFTHVSLRMHFGASGDVELSWLLMIQVKALDLARCSFLVARICL